MARELGLNPGKLGKISNRRQEPWKAPLPQFIEHLYLKRFGREQPRVVTPAEKWERSAAARKPARNAVATNARGDHLARRAVAKLARKRPSPLQAGRRATWAAGAHSQIPVLGPDETAARARS